MAQMHGDQCEATQKKSHKQRETVRVVESGYEHEEQQRSESQSRAGRQDVQSPPLQRQWQGIGSLTPSDPGRHTLAEEAFHEEGTLERYRDRSNELVSDRLGFTAPGRLATLETVSNDRRQYSLHIFR